MATATAVVRGSYHGRGNLARLEAYPSGTFEHVRKRQGTHEQPGNSVWGLRIAYFGEDGR